MTVIFGINHSLIYLCQTTYTNPAETVFDPFMGSGTAGVACLTNGRNFIGIEQDKNYFERAQDRIEAAVAGEAPNTADERC